LLLDVEEFFPWHSVSCFDSISMSQFFFCHYVKFFRKKSIAWKVKKLLTFKTEAAALDICWKTSSSTLSNVSQIYLEKNIKATQV